MHFGKPVTELIREQVSTRRYVPAPIDDERRGSLERFLRSTPLGLFDTLPRFGLVAASEEDSNVLRGLGTYGFIKGAMGYIIGAVGPGEKNLEDFGYLMEAIILHATDLGLGTCWLGGTFTKSRFATRFDLRDGEEIPAVTSIGYPAGRAYAPDALSGQVARSHLRLPWEALFFDGQFGNPLPEEAAREYSTALEMVRLSFVRKSVYSLCQSAKRLCWPNILPRKQAPYAAAGWISMLTAPPVGFSNRRTR
jgi:hypothetical protein